MGFPEFCELLYEINETQDGGRGNFWFIASRSQVQVTTFVIGMWSGGGAVL